MHTTRCWRHFYMLKITICSVISFAHWNRAIEASYSFSQVEHPLEKRISSWSMKQIAKSNIALWSGNVGSISHLVHGMKSRKSNDCSYAVNWSKILNIISCHVVRTSAWPIEVLAMQRIYNDILKVKNMLDHDWNIGCKV